VRALSPVRLAASVGRTRPVKSLQGAPLRGARSRGWVTAWLLFAASASSSAQSGRITGVTWIQSVDLRPLVEDSVPISQAQGTGPYRQLADGRLVRCIDGEAFCRFRRSGARATSMPIVQDLTAAVWGLGEGVSLHAHVRARESLGNDELPWPRSGDRFDALEAYLQVDRAAWRARLGRQWQTSSLGFNNFDGASLLARRGAWSAEAFAGRALVAGLNEAHSGTTLGTVEDLPPDEPGYLIGAKGAVRFAGGQAASAVYQRVIRTDRAGLYADRLALDATATVANTTLEASYAHDLMSGSLNELRLRATRELPRRLSAMVDVRRERPFFEWWTIWGAFSPVAFDEARAIVGWRDRDGTLSLDLSGGYRQYDETSAGLESAPLRTDGWRAGVGAEWSPNDRWLGYADYNADVGFGASRSDATGGFRWTPGERYTVGAYLSALQNIYEFRVGTGRILGLGIEGSFRATDETRLVFDGALYAHRSENAAPTTDWSQRRVSLRLEWTVGSDPGSAARTRSTGGGAL
jgi:hypothetical protein